MRIDLPIARCQSRTTRPPSPASLRGRMRREYSDVSLLLSRVADPHVLRPGEKTNTRFFAGAGHVGKSPRPQTDTKVLWTLASRGAHPLVMQCARKGLQRRTSSAASSLRCSDWDGLHFPTGTSTYLTTEYTGLTLGYCQRPRS
jgi:hypothetical protein